eukprot:398252_1
MAAPVPPPYAVPTAQGAPPQPMVGMPLDLCMQMHPPQAIPVSSIPEEVRLGQYNKEGNRGMDTLPSGVTWGHARRQLMTEDGKVIREEENVKGALFDAIPAGHFQPPMETYFHQLDPSKQQGLIMHQEALAKHPVTRSIAEETANVRRLHNGQPQKCKVPDCPIYTLFPACQYHTQPNEMIMGEGAPQKLQL